MVYAHAVDEAASRLRELREEGRGRLGLAALALGLAVVATRVWPALAFPLFLGALVMGALGIRAHWRRWDLLERLLRERAAYSIPEVRALALREATMGRRQTYATLIRGRLPEPGVTRDARLLALADELEALASELADGSLALDPVAAVACMRLLSDVTESPLFNPEASAEALRSRIRQIRSGFSPCRRAPSSRSGRRHHDATEGAGHDPDAVPY
jgi:hypothetical protein